MTNIYLINEFFGQTYNLRGFKFENQQSMNGANLSIEPFTGSE